MGRLSIVSRERISEELLKGFSLDSASVYFTNLDASGVLKAIIPEFEDAKKTFHDNRGHYGESVFQHTLDVLKRSEKHILLTSPIFKIALMFHDIGKPYTLKASEDGRIRFLMHEDLGAHIAKVRMKALRFSGEQISYVTRLIRLHMRTHEITKQSGPIQRRMVAELFVENGENIVFLGDLCLLAHLDSNGAHNVAPIVSLIAEFADTPKAITGEDLLDNQRFPAPIRGQLLRTLRVFQLSKALNRDALLKNHLKNSADNIISVYKREGRL